MAKESMKCEDVKELVVLYSGGQLTSDEVSVVESHIPSCSACASEVEEYKHLSSKLAVLKEEPMPEDMWDDMWSGIRAGIADEKKVVQFDIILKYAAMLLVGLSVGFFGYMFNKSDQEIAPANTATFSQRRVASENAMAGANRWVLPGNEVCPVDNKLGVAVADAPQGIQIKGIQEGSVAQNILGLQPNDIIIKFDQETIKDLSGLQKVVDEIGKTGKLNMTLTVVRDGKITTLNINGGFEQGNR